MADPVKRLGGFKVLKDLKAGKGGQGTVYQAVCEEPRFEAVPVGTVVALKVMAVQDDDDGSAYRKLEERTKLLVTLVHPNVVRYYGCFREAGEFSDLHVIVQEFVEGPSLEKLIAESPRGLDVDVALPLANQIAAGLEYTVSKGVVHRDIKPGNVIVAAGNTPKLIDFEVAHNVEGPATVDGSNLIGTFAYMSPDFTDPSFRGDELSDVFSFGVCFHEMLTGRPPFRKSSETSSTRLDFEFVNRWANRKDEDGPIRISSRVRRLLFGARSAIAHAIEPNRKSRCPNFTTLRKELATIQMRSVEHGGVTWLLSSSIGVGGFGEVFKAKDMLTGQPVAIKHLLRPEYAARFEREADMMRKINDRRIVRLIDSFTLDTNGGSHAFIVMDFLPGMPGQSLRDAIRSAGDKPLPQKAVITAFVRYAGGLATLHNRKIFHRDIKPANLYFPSANPENAAIMDLGIAKDASAGVTNGQLPGTIDYMPPECVLGTSRGSAAGDIYALGLCLYESLTGRKAYPALPEGPEAVTQLIERVRKETRPDLSGLDAPADRELKDLVRRMIEFNVKKRLSDAWEIVRRLDPSVPSKRPNNESQGFVFETDSDDSHSSASELPTIVNEFTKTQPLLADDDPLYGEIDSVVRRRKLKIVTAVAAGVVALMVGLALCLRQSPSTVPTDDDGKFPLPPEPTLLPATNAIAGSNAVAVTNAVDEPVRESQPDARTLALRKLEDELNRCREREHEEMLELSRLRKEFRAAEEKYREAVLKLQGANGTVETKASELSSSENAAAASGKEVASAESALKRMNADVVKARDAVKSVKGEIDRIEAELADGGFDKVRMALDALNKKHEVEGEKLRREFEASLRPGSTLDAGECESKMHKEKQAFEGRRSRLAAKLEREKKLREGKSAKEGELKKKQAEIIALEKSIAVQGETLAAARKRLGDVEASRAQAGKELEAAKKVVGSIAKDVETEGKAVESARKAVEDRERSVQKVLAEVQRCERNVQDFKMQ